jgi:hypothetical protein
MGFWFFVQLRIAASLTATQASATPFAPPVPIIPDVPVGLADATLGGRPRRKRRGAMSPHLAAPGGAPPQWPTAATSAFTSLFWQPTLAPFHCTLGQHPLHRQRTAPVESAADPALAWLSGPNGQMEWRWRATRGGAGAYPCHAPAAPGAGPHTVRLAPSRTTLPSPSPPLRGRLSGLWGG